MKKQTPLVHSKWLRLHAEGHKLESRHLYDETIWKPLNTANRSRRHQGADVEELMGFTTLGAWEFRLAVELQEVSYTVGGTVVNHRIHKPVKTPVDGALYYLVDGNGSVTTRLYDSLDASMQNYQLFTDKESAIKNAEFFKGFINALKN